MFTGNEDQRISLDEAEALTQAFRDANPGAVLGGYYSRRLLLDILNQPDCVGIRLYYGLDQDGQTQVTENVLVGVIANGNDIVDGVLGDRSLKTPPYSSATNSLNS